MNIQSDRGVILLLVVIFALILSTIGVATIQYAGEQKQVAIMELAEARVDLVAESGIEYAKAWITDHCINQNQFPENFTNNSSSFIADSIGHSIQTSGSYTGLFIPRITPDPANTVSVIIGNAVRSTFGSYTITSEAWVYSTEMTSGANGLPISGALVTKKTKTTKVQLWRGGRFTQVGNMASWSCNITPIRRNDGAIVLIKGDRNIELYNPTTKLFSPLGVTVTDVMWPAYGNPIGGIARTSSGKVLISCLSNGGACNGCNIYDSDMNTIYVSTPLCVGRQGPLCVALPGTEKVLIAGGKSPGGLGVAINDAEIYDVVNNTSTVINSMNANRLYATAVMLADGRVLISGGFDATNHDQTSQEIFDPVSLTFTPTHNMMVSRSSHLATLLDDGSGRVLILGGSTDITKWLQTELFSPFSASDIDSGLMNKTRMKIADTLTLLPSGQAFMQGNPGWGNPITIEMYEANRNVFVKGFALGAKFARSNCSVAQRLDDGTVLIVGGSDPGGNPIPTGELFTSYVVDYYPDNTYSEGPVIRSIAP